MKTINGETWCQSHLADEELHQLLEKVDADLAQEARQKGCLFCGGKLHRTDYDRLARNFLIVSFIDVWWKEKAESTGLEPA